MPNLAILHSQGFFFYKEVLDKLPGSSGGSRLDFRRSLVSGIPSPCLRGRSAGSFPEQGKADPDLAQRRGGGGAV